MVGNKINFKIYLLCILLITMIGCSKSNIPSDYHLDKEGKNGVLIVRLIKTGERKNEGTYINILQQNKRFFSNLNFVPEVKKHVYTIEMPAGNYTFCTAKFHGFSSADNRCKVDKKFEIKPGEISYIGTIEMEIKHYKQGGLTWKTRHYKEFDKVIIQEIKENYPNIDICGIKNEYGYTYANYHDDENCKS